MQYHGQEDADVVHKCVNIFCHANQFSSFPFCVPHTKPQDVRGLSKQYHMRFDPKLGHGIYAIHCINCAYAEFTSML